MSERMKKAISDIEDCIAKADITGLREIDQSLDGLKNMVEDHVMKIAGQGGDW